MIARVRRHNALVRLLVLAASALCLGAVGRAQTQPGSSCQKELSTRFAYDVVSVKPYDAHGSPSIYINSDTHAFSANLSVAMLLQYAFGVLMADEISGIPAWARSEQYAVDARMDARTTEQLDRLPGEKQQDELRKVVRSLLAERFGLEFHRETRLLHVYDLSVARGGLKMKASKATTQTRFVMDHDHLDATGIAMSNLVRSLSHITGRLVVNKTGMTGRYDVSLSWAADMDADAAQSGPSIFTAVQEQLGLKLDSAREPVETIVIDKIERPTAN